MMEDLFIIYQAYPIQCLCGVFLGILIPFVIYRFKHIIGVICAVLSICIGSWLILEIGGDWTHIYATCVMPIILGFSILVLFSSGRKGKTKSKKEDVMRVEMLDDSKKKHWITDLNRGVAIFGSSGAGKSASVIFFLMKHLSRNKFSGIINDYKDYELSEIAYQIGRASCRERGYVLG